MGKITGYSNLPSPAGNDLLVIVDVDDTSMAPTGTDKNITVSALLAGAGQVASVFGRTGAVTAQSGDYTAAQVTGAVQVAGDIGGTAASPQVTGTHLASPLPVGQGGTGTATGAPQNDVFAGPASGGAGAPSFRSLQPADLPPATTSAQGAVTLDGTASDLQPAGVAAAGSKGQAADAKHVHPLQPWQFMPEGYGAKGDGLVIYDASMTASSATLTCAGLTAPSAPSVSQATSGGTVAAGTYQVKITYVNTAGETVASSSTSVTTTTGASTITITSPAAQGNAAYWYAYVTQAGGSTYTRQQAAGSPSYIGDSLTLTAPPTSGGAQPPASNTTASAPFTSGDVGKVILVNGCGASGAPLSTTVSAFISASSVTLAASAGTTASQQLACYGTDDTAAVSSAVTAAAGYATSSLAFYCEVLFRPVIYMIAGALSHAGKGNAQVPLPLWPANGQPGLTIALLGKSGAGLSMFNSPNRGNTAPASDGTVLFSTLMGQSHSGTYGNPSVIGGPTNEQGYYGGFNTTSWNNVTPVIDQLTIMVPAVPTCRAIDLQGCIKFTMGRARAQTFLPFEANVSYNPAPGSAEALVTPQPQNLEVSSIELWSAIGWNVGIIVSSACSIRNLDIAYCQVAVDAQMNSGQGGATIQRLWAGECPIYIYSGAGGSSGPQQLEILCASFEVNQGQWGAGTTWHVYDPGSTLSGLLRMNTQTAPSAITVSGAQNMEILHEGGNGGVIRGLVAPPSVPASGTALVNPFWRHAHVLVSANGATITAIAVDGTTLTGVTSGMVRVPSGHAITLTYSGGTPAWQWVLD